MVFQQILMTQEKFILAQTEEFSLFEATDLEYSQTHIKQASVEKNERKLLMADVCLIEIDFSLICL